MEENSSLHYTLTLDDKNIIPMNSSWAYLLEVSYLAHKF